jgi:tetrahydromethanopterin S-methyltransferase subunit G
MPTATRTDVNPLAVLAIVREDAEQSQRASVDSRISVMAKAVIDLNDETRTETNRRLDHIETVIQHGFAEMRARFGEVNARFGQMDSRFGEMEARFGEMEARFGEELGKVQVRLDKLDQTVNKIGARVEEHARWIIRNEKGEPQG